MGGDTSCQCDSRPLDATIGVIASSTSCCGCLDSGSAQRGCSCASSSSSQHHHHNHHQQQHQSESCHCSKPVHCCMHQNVKSNCVNNNCLNGHTCRHEEEEESEEEEEEEELSSDEEDEDEDEDEQKCTQEEEVDEDEEEEEEENESNEEEEEEEEEDENLNCGNGLKMRLMQHKQHSMSDNEQDEEGIDSCLHEMELFTCNVCDRTYRTARSLAKHQVHKRHFGCSICDTVFPTLLSLEQHKHTLEHWSDDESNLSISLSRHQCDRHRNGFLQHNHPVANSLSNHGYPSDSLHLHNHVHQCEPDQAEEQHGPVKLSLNDTTIAGLLDSKSPPSRNGNYGNFVNSNHHNHPMEKGLSVRNNNFHLYHRQVDQPGADTRARPINPKPKPILASSLSSKLMASVFNFSSSNSTLPTHSDLSQCKQGPKQTLNSHKRLSKSAEEMESLL